MALSAAIPIERSIPISGCRGWNPWWVTARLFCWQQVNYRAP